MLFSMRKATWPPVARPWARRKRAKRLEAASTSAYDSDLPVPPMTTATASGWRPAWRPRSRAGPADGGGSLGTGVRLEMIGDDHEMIGA